MYIYLITLWILAYSEEQCPLSNKHTETPYPNKCSQEQHTQPIFSNQQFENLFLNHDLLNNNQAVEMCTNQKKQQCSSPTQSFEEQAKKHQIEGNYFISSVYKKLNRWIGFITEEDLQNAIKKCKISQFCTQFLFLYQKLAQKDQFYNLEHLKILKEFEVKQTEAMKAYFCLQSSRNHPEAKKNKFFDQKNRIKVLKSYLKAENKQLEKIFSLQKQIDTKINLLNKFLQMFFTYYYLEYQNPSDTFSSIFLRTFTIVTDIFSHEDIVNCVGILTISSLNELLQHLDIHHIFVNSDQIFKKISFLQLKEKEDCIKFQSSVAKLKKILKNKNFFLIITNNSEQFINIAHENDHKKQIKMLAIQIAKTINNLENQQKINSEL